MSTRSTFKNRSLLLTTIFILVCAAVLMLILAGSVAAQGPPGDVAYVTLSDSDLVALVDTATHAVAGTVDVGAAGCNWPWRAEMSPDGAYVYVACRNSDNVAVIETTGNTVVTVTPMWGIPGANGIAFTRDGAYALVGSRWNWQIAVVDTATYVVSSTIPTPNNPRSVAVHPHLDVAYATCSDSTIQVIDTTTFSIITSIPLPGGSDPWDVVVSPDGQWVFTADRHGRGLFVIDAESNTLYTTVMDVGGLQGLAVAPDGSRIYGADRGGDVRVIDGATFNTLPVIPGTGGGWDVAVTCNGSELYVSNEGDQVPVVDTATSIVTDTVDMSPYGSGARGIALCPQFRQPGVYLYPTAQSWVDAPGASVVYEVSLVNAVDQTDSFTLSPAGNAWTTTLSINNTGPLSDGASITFTVQVDIPPGATTPGESDVVTVTATSALSPTIYTDTTTLTTSVPQPVLLVDDDDGLDTHKYYMKALDALGYAYDLYTIPGGADGPSATRLQWYDTVIWYTANDWWALSNNDATNLKSYLDNGGRLLMSGGMLAENLQNNAGGDGWVLLNSYLGYDYSAGTSWEDFTAWGQDGNPVGDGLALDVYMGGDWDTSLEHQVSHGGPRPWAETAFTGPWGWDTIATTRFQLPTSPGYKTVFLGFNLAGVDGADNRETLLDRALSWLEANYHATVYPTPQVNGAQPGDWTHHWLTLKNTGLYTETYDLSQAGDTWDTEMWDNSVTTIITQIVDLAPNDWRDFVVSVTIPSGAVQGNFDVVTVTATPVHSPTYSADAVLTTRVPGDPDNMNAWADPDILASGGATSNIHADIWDMYGIPVLDGTVITFTVPAALGAVDPFTSTTSGGYVTAIFTASGTCGNAEITVDAGTAVGTVNVAVGDGSGPTGISSGLGNNVITADTTWSACSGPYIISDTVTIAPTAVLTIETGTTVRFNDWGTGMHVLGTLIATGQSTNTILFTSNNPGPGPGSWYGLAFGDDTTTGAGVLDYVTVQYAGQGTGWPNVSWGGNTAILAYNGASPDITNSTIQNNDGNGIWLVNTGPTTLAYNTIRDNNGSGIYAEQNSQVDVLTNTLAYNGGDGIYLQSQTGFITTSTVITAGINGGVMWRYYDYMMMGWPPGGWERPDYDDTGPDWFSGMTPISGWGEDQLFARYTFTLTAPPAGDYGLRIARDDYVQDVWVNGTRVYGDGGCYSSSEWTGWQSVGQSLQVGANTIAVHIGNDDCWGTGHFDLELAQGTLLYPLVQGNTIEANNGDYGLNADTPAEPVVQNNNFIDNNRYPLYIGANSVPEDADGNTFSGNGIDAVRVYGQRMTRDRTWDLPVGYYEIGDPWSYHLVTVGDGVTLTVPAGREARFNWDSGIHVLGTLDASGAAGNTIVFTSTGGGPGSWFGLAFGDNSTAGSGVLEYVTVENAGRDQCWPDAGCYGGGDTAGVLVYNGASPDIINSTIQNNSGRGLYLRIGSQTVQSSTIAFNGDRGIYAEQDSLPMILTNTIASNGGDGVWMESQTGFNPTGTVITAGVSGGVTWRYYPDPMMMMPPVPGWEQPGYPDSGWSTGLSPIGDQGTYPQVITLADWDWGYLYARYTFTLTGPLADGYALQVGRDDYVQGIWVNGMGVYGDGGCNDGNDWTGWQSIGQYLQVGANTIAVQIGNDDRDMCGGSGPEYFDLELVEGTPVYPTVQGNVIEDNGGYGLYADPPSEPIVRNNDFLTNTSYPLYIGANSVPEDADGNTFSGNSPDAVQLWSQEMTRDHAWDMPVDYYGILQHPWDPGRILAVSDGVTLTVPAGREARFDGGTGLHVLGRLDTFGTSADPIAFTSTGGGPGSWYGLAFGNDNYAGSGTLEYVTVENAGEWACNPWQDTGWCDSTAVLVYNGGSPDVISSTIQNNDGYGLYATQNSLPMILTNTIASNSGGGVYMESQVGFNPTGVVITAGVDGGVTWRYYPDPMMMMPPPPGWEQPGYPDSGWSTGLSPIGDLGTYPQVNTPADWDSGYLYARYTFTLTAPLAEDYRLRVGRDDYVQGIWVNGVYVYDDPSEGWWCENGNNWTRWIAVGQHLQEGANTIAVQIYNDPMMCGTPEEYFDLELVEGTSIHPIVQGNTIESNGGWGLEISTNDARPSILANTVGDNSDGGIYLNAPAMDFGTTGVVITAGVDGGVTWRYTIGGPGGGWEQPGYNDSWWNTGLTPIGDGYWVNTWANWDGDQLFARYTFTLTAPLAEEYRLQVARDAYIEGVWINGAYVYGDGGGCYNADGTGWMSVGSYLQEGSNTIAVQLPNQGCDWESYFDLEMIEGAFTHRPTVEGNDIYQNGNFGLFLEGSSPHVQDNEIYSNTTGGAGFDAAGMWIDQNSHPVLGMNDVYGNEGGGVYAEGPDTYLDLTGYTIRDNDAYPLRLGAGQVQEVLDMIASGALTVTGNGVKGMIVNGGDLGQDTTFSNTTEINLYYLTWSDTWVNDGVTLTIEPGVVVKAEGSGVEVQGTLNAVGTLTDPVYFTSGADDLIGGDSNVDGFSIGNPGDWDRLRFRDSSVGTLDYATVKYSTWGLQIYQNTAVTVTNSVFANGQRGIYVSGSPVLAHNTIQNNADYGIRVQGWMGWTAAPSIRNSTLRMNNTNLIVVNNATPLVEYNNVYDALGVDLDSDATVLTSTVRNNWWGEYPPDSLTFVGPLSDTTPLKSLRPTIAESTLSLSEPSPIASGTVTVTVDFNREMDTDYDPTVTFGLASPYDTYTATSLGWTGLFTWTGVFTVTGSTGDGTQTFAVSGARDKAGSVLDAYSVSTFPMDQNTDYDFVVDTVPPVVAVSVPTYTNALSFTVSWSGSDAASSVVTDSYDVQYSENGTTWADWLTQTSSLSATFGSVAPVATSDGNYYYVRARAEDEAGNVAAYTTGQRTLVDTTLPTSTIAALPPYTNATSVALSWSGNDPSSGTPSGVVSYDVYTSTDGTAFGLWLTTSNTHAAYPGADGQRLWFYTLARDNAGNVEATYATSTTILVDLSPPTSTVDSLPALVDTPAFTVSWSGGDPSAGEASGVASYDVYYSDYASTGPFKPWLTEVTSTTATFPGVLGETYYFYSIARDKAGNVESAPTVADTSTTVSVDYAVIIAPPADEQPGDPGAVVTYTLRVTNTGDMPDTFTLFKSGNAWTTDVPASVGPLYPGEGADVQVLVHVPSDAAGGATDVVTISVFYHPPGSLMLLGDTSMLTTTANNVYGLALAPATHALSGTVGTMVTYTLRVTNTGNAQDTFTVTVAGNIWTTDVPTSVGPLAAGAGTDIQVVVHIPSDAADGVTDTATIIVTSQNDDTKSAVSTLTTTAVVACIPVTGVTFDYAPSSPVIQSPVTFTATALPANADAPITYAWDFGDGGAGSGRVVNRTYALSDTYTVIVTATNCSGAGEAIHTEDVAVILTEGAQTTVDPATGGTLIYTDTQGNPTIVQVPGNAISEPITLLYTPVSSPTQPISPNLRFANHTFDLDAYLGSSLLSGFVFSKPVTITIHYSDDDVKGIDESSLRLYYWTGSVWDDAVNTCLPPSTYTRDLVQNVLGAPICHLSRFGVMGTSLESIYLPLVMRNF